MKSLCRAFNVPFLWFAILVPAVTGGCATVHPPALSVSQIVELSREGVPADEIIDRMKQSKGVYPLDATQLARLKEEGVPDAVINYMQRTYIQEARREQQMEDWELWPEYYWYPWGGGPYGPWGDWE